MKAYFLAPQEVPEVWCFCLCFLHSILVWTRPRLCCMDRRTLLLLLLLLLDGVCVCARAPLGWASSPPTSLSRSSLFPEQMIDLHQVLFFEAAQTTFGWSVHTHTHTLSLSLSLCLFVFSSTRAPFKEAVYAHVVPQHAFLPHVCMQHFTSLARMCVQFDCSSSVVLVLALKYMFVHANVTRVCVCPRVCLALENLRCFSF